jgi:hypothetical protein
MLVLRIQATGLKGPLALFTLRGYTPIQPLCAGKRKEKGLENMLL